MVPYLSRRERILVTMTLTVFPGHLESSLHESSDEHKLSQEHKIIAGNVEPRCTEHSRSVLPGSGAWDVTTLSGRPALVDRTIVACEADRKWLIASLFILAISGIAQAIGDIWPVLERYLVLQHPRRRRSCDRRHTRSSSHLCYSSRSGRIFLSWLSHGQQRLTVSDYT